MEKMERMVYGAVANGSGIIVYHSDFFELNPIIQALVSSIDFSQDQRRSFGAHERTKGFFYSSFQFIFIVLFLLFFFFIFFSLF